jgi:hypothetical protein
MTTNLYAPPRTDDAVDAPVGPPAPRSFARRLSFVFAGVGFVGFWSPVGVMASGTENELLEVAFGLIMLFAVTVHVLGMVIMFAAPRGRRVLPVLINGASLAIMVGVVILGLIVGKE